MTSHTTWAIASGDLVDIVSSPTIYPSDFLTIHFRKRVFEDHALHTINNRRTSEHSHSPAKMEQGQAPSTGKGARFWILFASLNVTLFLSALELLAVSNALPTIA